MLSSHFVAATSYTDRSQPRSQDPEPPHSPAREGTNEASAPVRRWHWKGFFFRFKENTEPSSTLTSSSASAPKKSAQPAEHAEQVALI